MKIKIYIFCILILSISSYSQEKITLLENYQLSFQEQQDTIFLTLKIKLKEKWFIYSKHSKNQKIRNPIQIMWNTTNLRVLGTHFSKTQEKWISFIKKKATVYSDSIQIQATAVKLQKENDFTVSAVLSYQGCSDRICLRPQKQTILLKNKNLRSKRSMDINPILNINTEPSKKSIINFDQSFWILMFILFIGGLFLNLTPCVYPLITISVGLFGSQTTPLKTKIFHSCIYVLGLMVSFSVLGVITSFSGSLFGSALQSPLAQIAIAFIFFILALSCFGLFEIRLPYSWINKFYNKPPSDQKTLLFHFSAGIFSGILAAPCIGPFVFALVIYTAKEGNVLKGLWMFSFLAFGLGFPYIILAALSSLIQKLPKTGKWLSHIKITFGFILILLALSYLKSFLFEKIYDGLFIFILISFSFYLFFFLRKKEYSSFFLLFKSILICLILGFITYYSYQKLFNVHLYLPWSPYSQEKMDVNNKHITLIYFESKIWCVACQEMKEKTYSEPSVQHYLQQFELLNVDVDNHPQADSLIQFYQVQGIPTVLLKYRHQISEHIVGFYNPQEFIQHIKNIIKQWK